MFIELPAWVFEATRWTWAGGYYALGATAFVAGEWATNTIAIPKKRRSPWTNTNRVHVDLAGGLLLAAGEWCRLPSVFDLQFRISQIAVNSIKVLHKALVWRTTKPLYRSFIFLHASTALLFSIFKPKATRAAKAAEIKAAEYKLAAAASEGKLIEVAAAVSPAPSAPPKAKRAEKPAAAGAIEPAVKAAVAEAVTHVVAGAAAPSPAK